MKTAKCNTARFLRKLLRVVAIQEGGEGQREVPGSNLTRDLLIRSDKKYSVLC